MGEHAIRRQPTRSQVHRAGFLATLQDYDRSRHLVRIQLAMGSTAEIVENLAANVREMVLSCRSISRLVYENFLLLCFTSAGTYFAAKLHESPATLMGASVSSCSWFFASTALKSLICCCMFFHAATVRL